LKTSNCVSGICCRIGNSQSGRGGGTGAKFLFTAMGIGALIQSQFSLIFSAAWKSLLSSPRRPSGCVGSGNVTAQSGLLLSSPAVSPAYIGVGYIIGPKLSSLNFSGAAAWGLLFRSSTYFIGPTLMPAGSAPTNESWIAMADNVWRFIVRRLRSRHARECSVYLVPHEKEFDHGNRTPLSAM